MNYKCILSLNEIKDYLSNSSIIAFDFETSPFEKYRQEEKAALDAHKSDIVGISFSVEEGNAIYVPLRHRVGKNVEELEVLFKYLKEEVFENNRVIKVAHNLAFETMFLYAKGIVIQEPCYDTIAAAQLTLKSKWEFRNLSDCGLKSLSASILGVELPSFNTVTNGRYFDELNPQDEETIRYGCADSDFALRLYNLFNNWFDKYLQSHRYITEKIESPTAVYCGIMKYNGIPMDKEIMLKKQIDAEIKIKNLRNEINEITGGVNIGANAGTSDFKRYLYKELELPVLKTTEKNKEAADDETLIMLKDWCKEHKKEVVHLLELVQEYRKLGKIKSTYIDGYLEYMSNATGRIHPNFFPLGTETGRFAVKNPNLQNAPRKDNDPVGVRRFIVAPRGKVILSLDFSQIELRVGAYYCRDERMISTYRAGGDIHAETTSVIYKIPFEKAADKNEKGYKERRTIAKNCNFGVFYGLYANGLNKTLRFKAGLNTSLEECIEIIKNLKGGYPGLARWQEEVKVRTKNNCYTETWLGRRRYLVGILSEDWAKRTFAERCALNTPIQGTAADILKLACGRIIEGLPKRSWLKPLLQIHDELVFEIPKDKVAEAVAFIKACMEEKPFKEFDIPIIAEAAVGDSYGNLKELEVK